VSTRARLILNPASGTDTAPDHAATLNERLRERYDALEIVLTRGRGDAATAAQRAAEDGCSVVFVGGGDGTLNEALNGVASAGALDRVTFGVIPLGTGNDFAAALGIPADVSDAVDLLLAGRTIRADLGEVNGRVFVNTSGGGFVAQVSESVTPGMKTIGGRLAYLVGGAHALWEFDPVRMTLAAEPGPVRFGAGMYAFAVCNSRFIGGGKLIAPHALIDDGLLDVCVIDEMPALEFVALLRRVVQGSHVDDPRVRYLQASSIRMDFERVISVNTDGEVFEASRCEYRVLPGAVSFFAGDAPLTVAEDEASR
jgi:diacylglycerol kinase (ATP)